MVLARKDSFLGGYTWKTVVFQRLLSESCSNSADILATYLTTDRVKMISIGVTMLAPYNHHCHYCKSQPPALLHIGQAKPDQTAQWFYKIGALIFTHRKEEQRERETDQYLQVACWSFLLGYPPLPQRNEHLVCPCASFFLLLMSLAQRSQRAPVTKFKQEIDVHNAHLLRKCAVFAYAQCRFDSLRL